MLNSELLNFDFYQNMLTIAILMFGYIAVFIFGARKGEDVKIVSFLYIWHTLFSIFYYLYSLYNAADAKAYYLNSLLINKYEFIKISMVGVIRIELMTSSMSTKRSTTELHTLLD